jgi:hypothetical protein
MPGDGRGSDQLRLPQAPRFDKYGLHAHDCECAKCDLGMRPSSAERDAARRSWERLEQMKAAAQAAPTDKAAARAAEKAKRRRKAFAAEARFTDQLIAKLSEPVKEPATPDQLEELKRQYPNLRRKPK